MLISRRQQLVADGWKLEYRLAAADIGHKMECWLTPVDFY